MKATKILEILLSGYKPQEGGEQTIKLWEVS